MPGHCWSEQGTLTAVEHFPPTTSTRWAVQGASVLRRATWLGYMSGIAAMFVWTRREEPRCPLTTEEELTMTSI
jgi:hypothetical protein